MKRRYDIDWIRDITVLSIIFFHSLIIFFTRESAVMYVRAGVNLNFCIYIESFMSRFCMPLLFLLAGFSVGKSLEKRTIKEFVRNRVRKLLIPLVVVSVTLNPIVSYIYGLTQGRTIGYGEHYFKFMTSISKDFESRTTGFGPMHLWFLLYLFLFSIICIPIFRKIKEHGWKQGVGKIAEFFSKPGLLLLFVIPYPFLFKLDIMDEMNPIPYLYIFLLGYLISTNESYQERLDRDKWFYTILAGIAVFVIFYGRYDYQGNELFGFEWCVKASRLLIPFAILGLGHSYIPNKKSKVLTYLNQANFLIYLCHMLVLTAVGYFVLKINISSVMQFIVINVLSYGICFLIFEGYRRVRVKLL